MTQAGAYWLDRSIEGHLLFFQDSLHSNVASPPQLPAKLAEKPKFSFSIDAILSTDYRGGATLRPHHTQTVSVKSSHTPLLLPPICVPRSTSHRQELHRLEPYKQQEHYNCDTDLHGSGGYPNYLVCRGAWKTCRRIRTIFTTEQLMKLEEAFNKQRYMTGTEKVLLASTLRLTETQVKVWFQNRRTKWRRSEEDKAQQSVHERQTGSSNKQ